MFAGKTLAKWVYAEVILQPLSRPRMVKAPGSDTEEDNEMMPQDRMPK